MTLPLGRDEFRARQRESRARPANGLNETDPCDHSSVEHTSDLLCVHDLEGRLLSVNAEPAHQLGYNVEELLRLPMRELVPPQFRPQFEEYLKRIARDGEAHGLLTVQTCSGERRVWEYHNKLHLEGKAAPIVHGLAHDITDRRCVDRELRKTAEGFRLLEEYAPALAIFDREMCYLHASQRWRTDYGLGDRNLRGLSHYEFFPEIPERWKQIHRRGLAGEVLREENDRFERANGSTQWIRWEVRPWHEASGTVGGIVIFAEDVTGINDRRRATALLEESEKRFRALYEQATVGICLFEAATSRLLRANPKYCEIVGRSEQDLLGRDVQSLTHPDDLAETVALLGELEAGTKPHFEMEKRYVRPDGSARWVSVHVAPLRATGDSPATNMAILVDITERKQAEEALRESAARFRLAQEAAKIGVFERNLQTDEILWSAEMGALFGLGPDQYPRSLADLLAHVHPEDRSYLAGRIEQSIQTGDAEGEWRVVWPDGTMHWIAGRWRVLKDERGKPTRLLGMDFDVTERKHAEEALRESEIDLKEAQRVAQMGSWRLDLKTQAITWSEQVNRILGLEPQAPAPNFDHLDRLLSAEAWSRAKQAVDAIVRSGQAQEIEAEFRRADGTTGCGLLRGEPVRGASGEVVALHGIAIDITSRRRVEEALRASAAELKEAQSVARMGSWHLDLKTQTVTASEQLFRIVGLPGTSPAMAFSDLADILPP